MDPHMTEWLNLAIRWAHMTVGVAWIGASFYFNWLENNLNRVNPKTGLAGDLWAIHGGGIYHLEKYKLAPPSLPENLHWFKWEAYFTWITGILLLCVVYYLNAQIYLLAPGSSLSPTIAIALGIAVLIAGWFIYDALCNSSLGEKPLLLAAILFVLIIAAAFGLSFVFSGRGTYIHIGAIIGTIMVGNVFRVIMPAQRNLVSAIKENRAPDPRLPAKGLLRSRHNNYLTLPVLFIMISNHFPSTFGSKYNWLILATLAVLSILVRHYFNTRHVTKKYLWTVPVAAVGMLALAFVTSPYASRTVSTPAPTTQGQAATAGSSVDKVSFAQVRKVITERCSVCHSATPTNAMFKTAPAGVMFDTADEIKLNAPRIMVQAVQTKVMPLGNFTKMTETERSLIGTWIKQGAMLK